MLSLVRIRGTGVVLWGLIVLVLLACGTAAQAQAATTIVAYKAQIPVNVTGTYSPSQWSDTPIMTDSSSGMTYAFKQNGTGLLFLMQWSESSPCSSCFGGIEIGFLNNTSPMGSGSTPTIMILGSPLFTPPIDEFISTGEQTPTSVETYGYTTQSVCGFNYANGQYTAQCYRPFKLHNAVAFDPFSALNAGQPIEIAFGVGDFLNPGGHMVTDMSTYQLTLSSQTYTATTATSSSSTSSTTISSSSTSSKTSSTTSSSSSIVTTISSSTASRSSTSSTSSGSTVSSSTTSTTTTASTSTTQSSPTGPNVSYYWLELAALVAGFTYFIYLVLLRYRRS